MTTARFPELRKGLSIHMEYYHWVVLLSVGSRTLAFEPEACLTWIERLQDSLFHFPIHIIIQKESYILLRLTESVIVTEAALIVRETLHSQNGCERVSSIVLLLLTIKSLCTSTPNSISSPVNLKVWGSGIEIRLHASQASAHHISPIFEAVHFMILWLLML